MRIRFISIAFLFLAFFSACTSNKEEKDQDIDMLISRMTVEEKVGQLTLLNISVFTYKDTLTGQYELDTAKLREIIVNKGVGNVLNVMPDAYSIEKWHRFVNTIKKYGNESRLKVPVLYGIDAIHGATYTKDAVMFPHNLAVAASRNPKHAYLCAKATARDIRACGLRWNFDPVLDVGRNPLWARFGETFGEDPYLCTQFGVAAVTAYEEDGLDSITGVASCMKHYIGYSDPATGKDRSPSYIPEQQLREIYLPPFRAAVKAGSSTIMINSGELNGIPVHANQYLLEDVLRGELGFEGLVVTDWEDIKRLNYRHRVADSDREAVRQGMMAGIDMSMVPFDMSFYDHLVDLVKTGDYPMERLNKSVRRVLVLKKKLGLFKEAGVEEMAISLFNRAENETQSLDAARAAMTLLKNTDSLLPLSSNTKVLLAGPGAHVKAALNGCWSFTWQGDEEGKYPVAYETVFDAFKRMMPNNVTCIAKPSYTDSVNYDVAALQRAAAGQDVIVLCLGENAYAETPGSIRDLALDPRQIKLAKAAYATGKKVILVLLEGRPRLFSEIESGAHAVLMAYWPGMKGGQAIVETLFGQHNPYGRLPFTYPKYDGYRLTYDHKYSDVLEELIPGEPKETGYDVQYPFGHGLSYSRFVFSNLKCDTIVKGKDSLVVTVEVKNIGSRESRISADLFVRDEYASVCPPVRRVKGMALSNALKPQQIQTLRFVLSTEDLAIVDQRGKLVVEPGWFEIQVDSLKQRFRYSL